MSLSNDEIDDIGEDFLNHICSINRISKTNPQKDRYGWDKYIEFINNGKKVSLFIQLKTSIKRDKKYPSASIKLSNWKNMADEVLPFFVLFLYISINGDYKSAFLVHIDKNKIDKSNKYIKLANIKKKPLNQTTLTLKAAEADKINIDGSDFKEKLINVIGSDLANYVSNKNKWNINKNYSFFSVGTRFKTDHSAEELSQFFLGYDTPISFTEINIFDNELNKIIKTYQDISGSSLVYSPKTVSVSIDLLIENNEVDSFSGQMFSVSMVEKENVIHKLRIGCDIGEFLIEGSMFKYTPQLVIHGRAPLILNARIARIVLAILEKKEIIFRFRKNNKSDIMFPVDSNNIKTIESFSNAKKMCKYLVMMKDLEDEYRIDSNHPFDPEGYSNIEDYKFLENIYYFLYAEYKVTRNYTLSTKIDLKNGEKIIKPYYFKYTIGPYVVCLGVCLQGEVIEKNIISGQLEIIEKYKNLAKDSSSTDMEYSNFINKIKGKYSNTIDCTRIIYD